jgi:tetratricopeptide (TPR) repeat protein
MARSGREAEANQMFSRLGKDALEAEDYLLLGKGLNHAGQEDAAVGLWEKAVAKDRGHPEAIEQLATAYTTRNRLVEAAQLFERLARLPGWEVRGGLNLASLRSELNDPSGAAAILEQLFARPDAKSLDSKILVRSRKLLARSYLRTCQARRARDELAKLMDPAGDDETFWLLSRAWLQDGDRVQTIAALKKSGNYRAEHPLELESASYLGEKQCTQCHQKIAHVYRGSRFATTLVRGPDLLALPLPEKPIADPADHGVTHRFQLIEDRIQVQTEADSKILAAIVDYAFGSPDRYFSLVGHDESGRSYILRLSHYQQGPGNSGWVRTTGHTRDAEGGREFLGKPMDVADGVLKCLFCHSTNPQAVLANAGPEANDQAIGCERCHGPGGNHGKAVEMRLPDLAIVTTAQVSGEGSLRLCAQCHAFHQKLDLPRTDPFWIRFQGTTLGWSRCYAESGGALDCVTCHDPHRNAEQSANYYEEKCLACHSSSDTRKAAHPRDRGGTLKQIGGAICPVSPTRDCLDCHMPSFRSEPLHATFADHYIRVHREVMPPRHDSGGRSGQGGHSF